MVGILKNNENGRSPRESNIEQDFIKETIEWFQKTRKWTGFQIYADTHQQTMSDIDPIDDDTTGSTLLTTTIQKPKLWHGHEISED